MAEAIILYMSIHPAKTMPNFPIRQYPQLMIHHVIQLVHIHSQFFVV